MLPMRTDDLFEFIVEIDSQIFSVEQHSAQMGYGRTSKDLNAKK